MTKGPANLLRALLALALVALCGGIVVWLPGWLDGWLGEFPQLVTIAVVIGVLTAVARIEGYLRR